MLALRINLRWHYRSFETDADFLYVIGELNSRIAIDPPNPRSLATPFNSLKLHLISYHFFCYS